MTELSEHVAEAFRYAVKERNGYEVPALVLALGRNKDTKSLRVEIRLEQLADLIQWRVHAELNIHGHPRRPAFEIDHIYEKLEMEFYAFTPSVPTGSPEEDLKAAVREYLSKLMDELWDEAIKGFESLCPTCNCPKVPGLCRCDA